MSPGYDRAREIKAFDETKAGVKGLVDAGITKIPPFFVQSSDPFDDVDPADARLQIPVIDLRGVDSSGTRREEVVGEVRRAAETLGFFQVVNRGIPLELLDEMLSGVRRFHEEKVEMKREYYSGDSRRKVRFYSNFDLCQAPAANWRDSVFCWMALEPPEPRELPPACRHSVHFKSQDSL